MSCEGHRDKFFQETAQDDKVKAALGTGAAGILDRIFQTGRTQAPSTPLQEQARQAEAGCRALFSKMQTAGIKPPTHSKTGLPRRDAQFGYAAVEQTLQAIRQNKPLPALAQSIMKASGQRRSLSAIGKDSHGILRCSSCGRFASPKGGHICPITATKDSLNRALVRRLGVSTGAFGGGSALEALLSDARSQGAVSMRHGLTGEQISCSLDGLPLAMATGFVPEAWNGQTRSVVTADNRVIGVLDATGMELASVPATATAAAAQAYGLALPQDAPVASAASLPPVSFRRTRDAATTSVEGGVAYDLSHFIGTEYRKGGSKGVDVTVYSTTYTVGDRSQEQSDWATARLSGTEPPPKGGVAVGRTLVEAMGILATSDVVETADGMIQVQESGRRGLISVYNPNTRTAGDVAGTPNASAAQMAAVIAHRALHPENNFDAALAVDLARMHEGAGTPLAAADAAYLAMKNGVLNDGNEITLGGTVSAQHCPQCGQFMGDAHICPASGQVEQPGDAPIAAAQPAAPAPAADQPATITSAPAPVVQQVAPAEPQRVQVDVNVDASVDGSAIADALRNAPPAQQNIAVQADVQAPTLDAEAFARAIRDGLAAAPQPAPVQMTFDTAAFAKALKAELGTLVAAAPGAMQAQGQDYQGLMEKMTEAIQTLAGLKNIASTPEDTRLLSAVDRLTAALDVRPETPVAAPTAAAPAASAPAKKPKPQAPPRPPTPRRKPSTQEERTPQEHILSLVRLPAPDPYLKNAPASVTGGGLTDALDEFIPTVDPNFEINDQTEKIMRAMSTMIQIGAGKPKNAWSRSFGIYGPPGTGKNTLARQLAASIQTVDADGNTSQGMNYVEANITPESSMQELIGTTVIAKDPDGGGTISRAQLGKIGLAAAMGSVICVNEIVRNPKLATALQSMIEDGEIQIDSPEQGMVRIPVHPSTIFVCTWNPGYEGDAERPGAAPLSRMMTMRLDLPSAEEQERRVESFFANLTGTTAGSDEMEASRKNILSREYQVPTDIQPSKTEVAASVRFFNELRMLAGGGVGARQIGLNSETPTTPGPRELNRFIALGKAAGWEDALETLKIICDQDDQFEGQWGLVRERFEAHFGADGQALGRTAPEQA